MNDNERLTPRENALVWVALLTALFFWGLGVVTFFVWIWP